MGYQRAGFEVVGVDIRRQAHYPAEFYRRGALELLEWFLTFRNDPATSDWPMGGRFDAIHASPPCQRFSKLGAMHPEVHHVDWLEPTRSLLVQTGLPFVIENVEGAPMLSHAGLFGLHGVRLCGSAFGLGARGRQLRRHRLFESNVQLAAPACHHQGEAIGVYGHGGHSGKHRMAYAEEAREAMGMDWSDRDGMTQAIPPAYTEFLGKQLREHLEQAA